MAEVEDIRYRSSDIRERDQRTAISDQRSGSVLLGDRLVQTLAANTYIQTDQLAILRAPRFLGQEEKTNAEVAKEDTEDAENWEPRCSG